MKFNCGPSPLEREKALQRWHPWFAWRPIRVGSHDCRWLEWIERRRSLIGGDGGYYSLYTFDYRAREDK